MKAFFKKSFALTDQGATDLIKASIASFFTYFVAMLPECYCWRFLTGYCLEMIGAMYFTMSSPV